MNQLQSSEIVEQTAGGERPRSLTQWLWPGVVLAILLAYLYISILHRLVDQWWTDPNFSHGFFVPAFSAFLVWKDRRRLAKMDFRPSWSGLLLIAGGLGILIFGVLGAELFLSRTSLLFVIAGLVIYFAGWRFFRAVLFPWLFLFLMVPPPTLIMNLITIPLQFLASDLATWFLRLLGVPVLQNGNVIQLSTMSLEVVEACSGIRSLISLGTLAIVYGYLLETDNAIRVILALAAVPIAVLANGLRIMGTGLTGLYWNPDKAQGFFHEFSGWVIFVLSLITLFILHAVLRALFRAFRRSTA
ncbi:MAG TPA: exosortase A [Terriglobia bacterium]|nr:exosortase A [Terriglobia bacterium]